MRTYVGVDSLGACLRESCAPGNPPCASQKWVHRQPQALQTCASLWVSTWSYWPLSETSSWTGQILFSETPTSTYVSRLCIKEGQVGVTRLWGGLSLSVSQCCDRKVFNYFCHKVQQKKTKKRLEGVRGGGARPGSHLGSGGAVPSGSNILPHAHSGPRETRGTQCHSGSRPCRRLWRADR